MTAATTSDASTAAQVARVRRLLDDGDHAGALPALEALFALFPDDDDILNSLGMVALARNDVPTAEDFFQRALARNPVRADTLCNLGIAAQQRGAHELAERCYRDSLALMPGFTQAAFQLGTLLVAQKRLDEAFAAMWAAGREIVADGRSLEAAVIFTELVKIAPRDVNALGVLGSLYMDLENAGQAEACFERVRQLDPNNAGAYNALGLLRAQAGQEQDAMRMLKRALERQPVFPEARNNLGNLYARLGRSADAIKQYRLAVAQRPDYADAWINLADEFAFTGDGVAARAACERCLEILPDHALAHLRRGQLLLAEGNYAEGWRAHEWRVAAQTGADYMRDPRKLAVVLPRPSSWAHSDLAGKHLLVLWEEGIGDEVFCLRFVPGLRARGACVSYLASPKLRSLLALGTDLDHVLTADDPLPDFDHALAVGDLGLVAIAQGDDAVPAPFALRADATHVEPLRLRLAQATPPYLGVTWRAGLVADGVRRKAIPLEALAAALAGWPGSLVALQRGLAPGEVERLQALSGRAVVDLCDQADDIGAMAAALTLLDDYVGVSNTNMHLRASLGRSARVLVRAAGEWRWQRNGDRSPWFPQFTLYREQRDWRAALARLERDIQRP